MVLLSAASMTGARRERYEMTRPSAIESLGETSLAAPGYRKAIELRPGQPVLEQSLGELDTRVSAGDDGHCDTLIVIETGSIPGRISLLTGITDAIVCDAPRPEYVLASIVELLDGAVLVGHNVAFDRSMLTRAFEACGLGNPIGVSLDTLALARRLLRDEVPDCTLGTLAAHLRLDHRPTHRALTDALATVDLLHHLIERSAGYGVVGLDDLIGLTRLAGHPWVGKLALTAGLPRSPGVYTFVGRAGQPIYVGTATDVRSRVRSYFGADDRRSIRPLLRDATRIDAHPAPHPLVAHVWEQRLLAAHLPEYNRSAPRPADDRYVRLTDEPFPRLAITKHAAAPGVVTGPVSGQGRAQRVIEAIHDALPLRRCTLRPRADRPIVDTPCAAAQLGRSACPCAAPGPEAVAASARTVGQVRRALAGEPELVLAPLLELMSRRAAVRRYEEAGVDPASVYEVSLAGNATMTHLVLGIPPEALGVAPFVMSTDEFGELLAADLGLALHPRARAYLFPSLGAYVGGDIVAGMLATGMDRDKRARLFVDVGTNCEIVLSDGERLVATAAPAGPAFEGGAIRRGMRAADGAIEVVKLGDDVELGVIGGVEAVGLCGSGLVDAVAELVRVGLLDHSGRFVPDEDAAGIAPTLAGRLTKVGQERVFVLHRSTPDAPPEDCVYLSQRDIRELQFAKAAIATGWRLLCEEIGLDPADIQQVLLAGSFGSYLSPAAAIRIGLVPTLSVLRIVSAGNVAGEGAKMVLLSSRERAGADALLEEVQYVELSDRADFNDRFVEQLAFPG